MTESNQTLSRPQSIRESLLSLSLQVREIRALVLIDDNGLPMVSTLRSGRLEEALCAFGGAVTMQFDRARRDFETGPPYQAHFMARDRQIFLTPVVPGASLVALCEASATPATIGMHLMALARDILPRVRDSFPGTPT